MCARIKSLFLFFLLLMTTQISGCLTAGLGPQFTQPASPEAGKAIIYVYRERVAMTGSDVPGVKMNDDVIVKALPEVNYFPVVVEPGIYTFSPKLFGIYKSTPAMVEARAGQVYYVNFRLTLGHLQFANADQDAAMAYMATCYMINPNTALDPRVMVSAQKVAKAAPKEQVAAPAAPPAPAAVAETPPVVVEQPAPVVAAPVKTSLFIDAVPADARIRIMNIKPKFRQGIELKGGRYHVEVTAPGYKKYLEWIQIEKGEVKQLSVVLGSNAPKAEPVVVKQEVEAAVKAKVVKAKKVAPVKAPATASAEVKRYASMFQSTSSVNIRNAAKNLYYRHSDNAYLASEAERCLLNNYTLKPRDNMHVDAMAWLCKALARTGDSRFVETLTKVAETAPSRKVKKYAQQSLGLL